MSAATTPRPRGLIRSLVGIRGYLSLVVVAVHLAPFAIALVPVTAGFFLPVWHHAYVALDLFFVLSGFVVTAGYRGVFARWPGWAAFGKFLWARLSRFYPVHLAVLAVLVGAVLGARAIGREIPHGGDLGVDLLRQLTLTSGWGGADALTGGDHRIRRAQPPHQRAALGQVARQAVERLGDLPQQAHRRQGEDRAGGGGAQRLGQPVEHPERGPGQDGGSPGGEQQGPGDRRPARRAGQAHQQQAQRGHAADRASQEELPDHRSGPAFATRGLNGFRRGRAERHASAPAIPPDWGFHRAWPRSDI